MCADGADLRGFSADNDMTAVAALPHLDLALGKDFGSFKIVKQGAVTLFMVLFDCGNHAELCSQCGEALLFGCFGKALIHIRPLVVLTLGGCGEVRGGIANSLELFEPHLCVFFFVIGGFQEQGCHLLIAFLLGDGGKVGIFIARLRLTGKGGLKILFGLRAGVGVYASTEQ